MRKVQPVSFSLSDPFENQLYKFATTNGAFSKYIKRLIQKDMEHSSPVISTKKAPDQPNVIQGGKNTFSSFKLG
jgi:hypothetical protein